MFIEILSEFPFDVFTYWVLLVRKFNIQELEAGVNIITVEFVYE